jgi:protein SCO1/2
MNHRILSLAVSLTLVMATHNPARPAEQPAAPNQVHHVRGVVRQIAPDRLRVVIQHEMITNYMVAMTMPFIVRDTNELNGVAAGDTITFLLNVAEDTHWISGIQRLSGAANNLPPATRRANPSRPEELKPGDPLPDYELLAEDGKRIRFSAFRGKALAFTFIFTRCPLPDYCPRMGSNFAKARGSLLAQAGAATNWQFLSISFDPDYDQPAVLTSYANLFRAGSADRWLFAAAPTNTLTELAPRLDLMIHHDVGGGISHNLRTVVLDPQGRIHRQFDGNEWTPQQLAEAVLDAARARPQ